jgi:hypothetical protein
MARLAAAGRRFRVNAIFIMVGMIDLGAGFRPATLLPARRATAAG